MANEQISGKHYRLPKAPIASSAFLVEIGNAVNRNITPVGASIEVAQFAELQQLLSQVGPHESGSAPPGIFSFMFMKTSMEVN